MSARPVPDEAVAYEIHLQGRLDPAWSDWFDGFTITPQPSDETVLIGRVADQAALHGILSKIGELHLPLLLVKRLGPETRPGAQPEERSARTPRPGAAPGARPGRK